MGNYPRHGGEPPADNYIWRMHHGEGEKSSGTEEA